LRVPDDIARWRCPQTAAEHKFAGRALLVELPWDLSGDPDAAADEVPRQ
jgi:hypothetical protein